MVVSVSTLSATSGEKRDFARTFRAKICPADNSSAEEELQREIRFVFISIV